MSRYEDLRQQHLRDAERLTNQLVERMAWSRERLATHRRDQLRRLLSTARDRSPWHRRRLAQIDPAGFDVQQIDQLPVMTKDDLMGHFDEIVTDRRLTLELVEAHLEALTSDAYLLDRYHAAASGGSTGQRGVFVYDWDEWALAYLSWVRHMLWARAVDPELGETPLVIASVSAQNSSHMSSSFFQTFSTPEITAVRLPVTLPLEEIVAGLNQVQPAILQGYPSALYGLTDEARAGRLRIRPRRIFSSSEPLLPEIRDALEETWGVPVWNAWGASEGGGIGTPCERGRGMHLSDDLFLVEPVDAHGRPVQPGVRSAKVYVTNLFNLTLPLIRYEITDEVTLLPGSCPCGSAHQRIDDIHGRLDDTFVYVDVLVHPHVFRSPLGRQRNVIEYQVRQTARGAEIAIRSQGPVDVNPLRDEIRAGLKRVGVAEPVITITLVERLERQATGKLKRFVPLATASTGRQRGQAVGL
jgi:phenylacetate-CoA ligase